MIEQQGSVTRSLLVITGGMGAGKTSVLAEASDILALRQIVHAAIDLDALGLAFLPSATSDGAMFSNLRSVCEHYAALGVRRFLLARAMETQVQLEICREASSAAEVVVCRIASSMESMQGRLRNRETGVAQREYLARAVTLNSILDDARLENFT